MQLLLLLVISMVIKRLYDKFFMISVILVQIGKFPKHHKCMYNRFLNNGNKCTYKFLSGVDNFVFFAMQQQRYQKDGIFRCSCKKHQIQRFYHANDVKMCLYKHEFMENYQYQVDHGEFELERDEYKWDHLNVRGMCDTRSLIFVTCTFRKIRV